MENTRHTRGSERESLIPVYFDRLDSLSSADNGGPHYDARIRSNGKCIIAFKRMPETHLGRGQPLDAILTGTLVRLLRFFSGQTQMHPCPLYPSAPLPPSSISFSLSPFHRSLIAICNATGATTLFSFLCITLRSITFRTAA